MNEDAIFFTLFRQCLRVFLFVLHLPFRPSCECMLSLYRNFSAYAALEKQKKQESSRVESIHCADYSHDHLFSALIRSLIIRARAKITMQGINASTEYTQI